MHRSTGERADMQQAYLLGQIWECRALHGTVKNGITKRCKSRLDESNAPLSEPLS